MEISSVCLLCLHCQQFSPPLSPLCRCANLICRSFLYCKSIGVIISFFSLAASGEGFKEGPKAPLASCSFPRSHERTPAPLPDPSPLLLLLQPPHRRRGGGGATRGRRAPLLFILSSSLIIFASVLCAPYGCYLVSMLAFPGSYRHRCRRSAAPR
jgi:hypothetical protein